MDNNRMVWKKEEKQKQQLKTDWQEQVKEEQKTPRFCSNCGETVLLEFRERHYYFLEFGCPVCGDPIRIARKRGKEAQLEREKQQKELNKLKKESD